MRMGFTAHCQYVQTAVHLHQVIFNLSNNAMDAIGHAASTLRIVTICAAVREPCQVEVSIMDSGPGIPDDQLGAVFDTFLHDQKGGHWARTIDCSHHH